MLWLFESHSRTAWILHPTRREVTGGDPSDYPGAKEPITWARSPREHLLEDGLLLIAMHALAQEAVLGLARDQLPELVDDSWVALDDVSADALAELRRMCQKAEFGAKLVVMVLGDSALSDQLEILDQYGMASRSAR